MLRVLRRVPALGFVLLSSAAFAGTAVTLGFPDATDKIVFESATWPKEDPAKSTTFKAVKADYTVDSTNKADHIYVVDVQSGKVATKAIGDIQNNTWTITKEEFSNVYKVKVDVSTPKGPVAAASVEFNDASGKRTKLIDPSSNGEAAFLFVKPGEVKVAVTYKADGKDKEPVKQSFTVGGDKDATLKIALPDGEAIPAKATATTAAGNAPAAATGAPAANTSQGDGSTNPAGNLLGTVLGLAFIGGVAYFLWKFVMKNPDKVKDTLTKLGADIPQPGQDNAAQDPVPIAPIAPQPMQQIMLDGAAPSPVASPSAGPISMPSTAAPVMTGIPKLIASDGSAFDLPDGETVVGREFGNGLVVPNDTVSRKHATILKMGTSVEVQDHGSTNGTWVNGMKVAGSQTLTPGDKVRFGSIEYRYEG